jgi:hypothetical protein
MARASTTSTPKIPTPEFKVPEFKFPEAKLPKIDFEALFGLQTANLAAAHEVHSVTLEAVQAIAKIQYGLFEETVAGMKALLAGKSSKEPQAMLADVKAAAEKAVTAGKQGMDLGVAAQQRVAELVAKRVQANIDEFKSLAA